MILTTQYLSPNYSGTDTCSLMMNFLKLAKLKVVIVIPSQSALYRLICFGVTTASSLSNLRLCTLKSRPAVMMTLYNDDNDVDLIQPRKIRHVTSSETLMMMCSLRHRNTMGICIMHVVWRPPDTVRLESPVLDIRDA